MVVFFFVGFLVGPQNSRNGRTRLVNSLVVVVVGCPWLLFLLVDLLWLAMYVLGTNQLHALTVRDGGVGIPNNCRRQVT